MVHFQIEPLTDWGKPKTPHPRVATFRVGWQQTIDDLVAEVDHLGGKVVACQIEGVTDADVRRDGMLRASARVVGFQGVKVSFDSKHGPLTYATDAFTFWKDNVRAIALGLTALRAVDRYGITKSGEQYTGWRAIAAEPMEDTLTPESARLVFADALGVPPAGVLDAALATKEGVSHAFKMAAKKYHPDVPETGNESVMRLITKARDVLLEEAR